MSAASEDRCREVQEALSSVLDGTAPAPLFEHIADCDACRDLKHDAARAAEIVAPAGADFVVPEGFEEWVLAKVMGARPSSVSTSGVKPASASDGGVGKSRDATEDRAAAEDRAAMEDRDADASSSAEAGQHPIIRTEQKSSDPMSSARTALSPIAEGGASSSTVKTLPLAAVAPLKPAETVVESDAKAEAAVPSATDTGPSHAVSSNAISSNAVSSNAVYPEATLPESVSDATSPPVQIVTEDASSALADRRAARRPIKRAKFGALVAGGMALAAAAGFALYGYIDSSEDEVTATVDGAWTGKLDSVARASADKDGGVELCDSDGDCAPIEEGDSIASGAILKTDSRTRIRLALADGSTISVDRSSELALPGGKSRTAELISGMLVAEVEAVDGARPARFILPNAEVEVLGTKFALTATDRRSSVEVARGEVSLTNDRGDEANVRAGEEAMIVGDLAPVIASTTSLSDMMEWSDHSAEEVDAPVLRGLGELRARKPGEKKEKDRAVRLSKHSVKVRVVDVIARTEIDETFTNDTDEELEGIFRFPLPPDAQIERLALEVDGELMEGAFVDRDRGAAIWRGVIQNAAPQAPRPQEEIIWVPGPWRDPALLEWQRGGRFELKIFPIPKRGSRRVVLTYTQVVGQTAGVRRFTYPLAHDPSGSTTVDNFDLDVQVLGGDPEFGVSTRGYELTSASSPGGGDRRTFSQASFVPAGDLTVEYALPDRDKEITTWAYRMDTPKAIDAATASATPALPSTAPANGQAAAKQATEAIVNDDSAYVAIALRPKLPRWQEGKERLHVLVVDASRSMVGERYARATTLAASLVREMDRRDSFMVMACDTTCQGMSGADAAGGGTASQNGLRSQNGLPTVHSPSAAAADDVERFLGGIDPDGGSDIAASMEAARAAASVQRDLEMRVIYLGDGTPSVGPTQPAHLEAAVRHSIPAGQGSVIAVPLGTDADLSSLRAVARGGGGVVVPYVPGQRVAAAALDVLGAAYGAMLRDAEVELPAGLTQVSPVRLDTFPAGGEQFVVARMSGDRVEGEVRLRGQVSGESFEQKYAAKIVATSNAGNAFVPRLFAAHQIEKLEREGAERNKNRIVELSKRFAVASRHTSLLVLESEAMFDAFGLERNRVSPIFTGELQAQSESGESDKNDDLADEGGLAGLTLGSGKGSGRGAGFGGSRGEIGQGLSSSVTKKPARTKSPSLDSRDPFGNSAGDDFDAAPPQEPSFAPPAPTSAPFPPPPPPSSRPRPDNKASEAAEEAFPGDMWREQERRRGRDLVPMRKVFDRKAQFFDNQNQLIDLVRADLSTAENALQSEPDSRDRTVELFRLLSASGRVGEASELAARWSGRDALDPEALIARADLAARQGDRERAIRILGGLADVRPGDAQPQERLAELQERAGNFALACEHRISLAEMNSSDVKVVAAAARCSRDRGMTELSSLLVQNADEKLRDQIERLIASSANAVTEPPLSGDIRLTATWTGGEDLDLALVDKSGRRISWMGSVGTLRTSARDVTSRSTESLGLLGASSGHYVIEIARTTRQAGTTPISGEVKLTAPGGQVRTIPFTMNGERTELGTVKVFFTSRLVPISSPFNSWR